MKGGKLTFYDWALLGGIVAALIVLGFMLAGCLTKEPVSPQEPTTYPLTLSYENEDADDSIVWGNFDCGWCSFPMTIVDGVFLTDPFNVAGDQSYICNVQFTEIGSLQERWAASSDTIFGELRGKTTEMMEFVAITALESNGLGSFNFSIRLNEDGVIEP